MARDNQKKYFKVAEICQVQNALRKLIGDKLVNDGYYDLSELDFNKYKGSNVYDFFGESDDYASLQTAALTIKSYGIK